MKIKNKPKIKSKIITLIIVTILLICPSSGSITNAAANSSVYLGGEPFGIKMLCDGVIVIGLQDVETSAGTRHPAKDSGINVNDIIMYADDEHIESSDELKEIIESSNGNSIVLRIKRADSMIEKELVPATDINGEPKAGLWIKDSAAGLGTITFYSCENNGFCGLGHAICESQTGAILPILSGDVELAYITSVKRSEGSDIGTLNGYFTGEEIGKATENLENGIFGEYEVSKNTDTLITIADKSEVKPGKATILTTIEGSTPKEYEAEIMKVYPKDSTKNIVIRITDEELLNKTGGIVQGMSGSPIIQDGKLAGALTHVIVNKSDLGYGIYAENMLSTAEELF